VATSQNIHLTGGVGYIGSHTVVERMAAGEDMRRHLALAAVSDQESLLIPIIDPALHFS
jgi:UDP-glucose 4-epimerase